LDENLPNQLLFDKYFEGEEKYDFLLDTSSNQSSDSEENKEEDDDKEN